MITLADENTILLIINKNTILLINAVFHLGPVYIEVRDPR